MDDYGIQLTQEEQDKLNRLVDSIHARVAKEPMTPRERYERVFLGETPDRIPIQVSAIGLHSAANYGVNPSALYMDPTS